MKKPYLPNAKIIERFNMVNRPDFMSEAAWEAIQAGLGTGEYGTKGDFGVNSKFTLLKYRYESGDGFACNGTKSWLSIFKLTGGCNHLDAFKCAGTEKSEDYDSIPEWRILDLPNDYSQAISMIENLYTGKTIRVIAKSGGQTQYGTSYYLFALDQ